ncbi:hypothetical protein L226DRAFT_584491 [Lentinus tigrinus ALCF2SS1-7]|uniref:uncharacterized protein n=1 Tax=Lentinus tigrinus ALCF2SS1-7 TaxID=1328758 RepID=UPI00116604F7|nr:hypothetical protein L226DRAFT_584491 [Lentinus tigrinus ALCF2SS1-7]
MHNSSDWTPNIVVEPPQSPEIASGKTHSGTPSSAWVNGNGKANGNGASVTVEGPPLMSDTPTITHHTVPVPTHPQHRTPSPAIKLPCFLHSKLQGASLMDWLGTVYNENHATSANEDMTNATLTRMARYRTRKATRLMEMTTKSERRTRVRSTIQSVLIVTKARDNRLIKLTRVPAPCLSPPTLQRRAELHDLLSAESIAEQFCALASTSTFVTFPTSAPSTSFSVPCSSSCSSVSLSTSRSSTTASASTSTSTTSTSTGQGNAALPVVAAAHTAFTASVLELVGALLGAFVRRAQEEHGGAPRTSSNGSSRSASATSTPSLAHLHRDAARHAHAPNLRPLYAAQRPWLTTLHSAWRRPLCSRRRRPRRERSSPRRVSMAFLCLFPKRDKHKAHDAAADHTSSAASDLNPSEPDYVLPSSSRSPTAPSLYSMPGALSSKLKLGFKAKKSPISPRADSNLLLSAHVRVLQLRRQSVLMSLWSVVEATLQQVVTEQTWPVNEDFHNVPYMLVRGQVDKLAREVDTLRTELKAHRSAYETLVSHIPQLVGMQHGPAGLDPASGNTIQAQPTPVTHSFVLGYGWDYPSPRPKPSELNGEFKWWSQKQWDKTGPKGGGKQGQHDTDLNVAQLFIEGEDGEVVDGYTAKDCRDVARALIRSLILTGQAPATEGRLSHEARVYIHVMLSRKFPFLLLCDNAMWKINLLIKQVYPGAIKNFRRPKECDDDNDGSQAGSASRKRSRRDSSGANGETSAPKRARAVGSQALLTPMPLPDDLLRMPSSPPAAPAPVLFAAPMSTASAFAVPTSTDSSGSTLSASSSSTLSASSVSTVSAAPLSTVSTAPLSTASAPSASMASAAPASTLFTAPASSAAPASTRPAAPASTPSAGPPSMPSAEPVSESIPSTVPASLPSAAPTPLAASPATPAATVSSSLGIVPVARPFTSLRRSTRHNETGHNEESVPMPITGDSEEPATVPLKIKGRAVKDSDSAKETYKPNVISEQNLYLRRVLAATPDLSWTVGEFKKAFKELDQTTREDLRAECTEERKKRKARKQAAAQEIPTADATT